MPPNPWHRNDGGRQWYQTSGSHHAPTGELPGRTAGHWGQKPGRSLPRTERHRRTPHPRAWTLLHSDLAHRYTCLCQTREEGGDWKNCPDQDYYKHFFDGKTKNPLRPTAMTLCGKPVRALKTSHPFSHVRSKGFRAWDCGPRATSRGHLAITGYGHWQT